MEIVEETFEKTTEEYKSMKWLKDMIDSCNDDSLTTHYNMILYYLVINLLKKNKQLKTNRDEAIELVKEIKLHYQQHPTMIPSVKIDRLSSLLERGKE